MLIKLGEYDYLLAGSGVVLDFKTKGEKAVEERKQLGEDGFALGNDDSTSQRNTTQTRKIRAAGTAVSGRSKHR